MKLPNKTQLEKHGTTINATMLVDETLPYLDGHFERKAVLPGVVHTGWAIAIAEKVLGKDFSCHALKSVKCTRLVLPPVEMKMTINYNEEKGQIKFRSDLNSGKCASGIIMVGQGSDH